MLMTRSIKAIDVTPSGSAVAAIDQRGEVRVWSGGRHVASWRADPSGYQVAWLDNGEHLMTLGTSGLQSWTAAGQPAGHRVASKRGHEVLRFQLSRDRKTIAINMYGNATFVDVADLTDPAMAGVRVPTTSQSQTQLSDDGTSLLIVKRYPSGGSSAAEIKIHHVATGIVTTDAWVRDIDPTAIALSPSEERIALAERRHAGHCIALVRASDGTIERRLEDEGGSPLHIEFSPDGTKLWSSGPDGHGRIWDVAAGARFNVPGAYDGVWASTGDALFVVENGGKEVRRVTLAAPRPARPAVLRRTAAR